MSQENWYLKNKKRILREINFAIPHYKKFIAQEYGMELANSVVAETIQRFEDLLPDLPFIGGDENFLTENLYLSAAMLAMYQSLKAWGKSVEEAARLIYLGTSAFYGSFPFRLLLRWQGGQLFGRKRIENASGRLRSVNSGVIRMIGYLRLWKVMEKTSSLVWITPNAASSNI